MDHARRRRSNGLERPARAVEPVTRALEARLGELLAVGETKQAATEAIRGYGPALLRYLRGLLGDEGDAREAFSDLCERIWSGLPRFRHESTVRTWSFRLAWSAAADLRKEAWRARAQRLGTTEAERIEEDRTTRSWLRAERLRLTLDAIRKELTLEEQSLLQLRIDQRLSWAECAEVLAIRGQPPTAEAVMKRFGRIKAQLRKLARRRRLG